MSRVCLESASRVPVHVVYADDRTRGAPVITTGDQAGSPWVGSHLPCVRRAPASLSARGLLAAASRRRGVAPHRGGLSSDRRSGTPIRSGCTVSGRGGSRVLCPARAMAQMQAARARALATTSGLAGCPRAVRSRQRVPRRPWACPRGSGWPVGAAPSALGEGGGPSRIPGGPGARAEGPAGDGMAGCGAAAVAAAGATGGRTGGAAPRAQERSGVRTTAPGAERGAAGDGDRAWAARQRLERRHDGGETPPLARRPECGLEARPPCLLCSNGAAVRLADQRRRRRGTDHGRQPAPLGGPPSWHGPPTGSPGAAGRPAPGTWRPGARGMVSARGAAAVAAGLVLDCRDIDWRQLAGAQEAGAWGRLPSSGCDAVARLLRDQRRGHDPAEPGGLGEIARRQDPQGPAA